MNSNGIRAGVRIPLELPVVLRWKGKDGGLRETLGKTGAMSGNGFFVLSSVRLRHDTRISFIVTFPKEVTKNLIRLYGRGRVVRQGSPRSMAGIGAIIDDYEIRPTIGEA